MEKRRTQKKNKKLRHQIEEGLEEYYESAFYGYRGTSPSSKLELVSVPDDVPDSSPDQAFFTDDQETNIKPLFASLGIEEEDFESSNTLDIGEDFKDSNIKPDNEEVIYNPFTPILANLEIQMSAPPPSLASSIEQITERRIDIGHNPLFPHNMQHLRKFSYFEGVSSRNLSAMWWNNSLTSFPATAAQLGGMFTHTNIPPESKEAFGFNDELPTPDALTFKSDEEEGGTSLLLKIGHLFKL